MAAMAKSPIVRGVKYDCLMHPLKDQREGVKYGRGVKYGVTPAVFSTEPWPTVCSGFFCLFNYLSQYDRC